MNKGDWDWVIYLVNVSTLGAMLISFVARIQLYLRRAKQLDIRIGKRIWLRYLAYLIPIVGIWISEIMHYKTLQMLMMPEEVDIKPDKHTIDTHSNYSD